MSMKLKSFFGLFELMLKMLHSHSLLTIFCGDIRGPDCSFSHFIFILTFVCWLPLHCAASAWEQNIETAATATNQDTCAEPVEPKEGKMKPTEWK